LIQELQEFTQRAELLDNASEGTSVKDVNIVVQARNKVSYTYRKIPAAFLEIVFPTYRFPILYEDVDISMDKKGTFLRTIFPNTAIYQNINSFSNCCLIADYDFD
jgi:hypothetical protein